MTEKRTSRAFGIGFLSLLTLSGLLAGCTAVKTTAYATPDYPTWKRTTDVVLDYPIPGHQDRFRIPRMNDVGFKAKPTMDGNKLHWDFPEGTVIVKEVYQTPKPAAGETPIQLTIMVKAPKDPLTLRADGSGLPAIFRTEKSLSSWETSALPAMRTPTRSTLTVTGTPTKSSETTCISFQARVVRTQAQDRSRESCAEGRASPGRHPLGLMEMVLKH